MKQLFLILILGLFICNFNTKKSLDNVTISKTSEDKIIFHKLKKLFVTGDFDGDGTLDTLQQHNFSGLTKTEIINSPDPFHNEWDSVVNWFYNQDANLFLTINKPSLDTLNLGTAQGLYCLINIGDINIDGNPEIATVIDYLDYSNLNSCKIYSLFKGKWTLLKKFNINESSFECLVLK